ncbi:MAG: BRCT domain-containing protein [Gemmatimonadaceae bacterium]
MLLHGDIDKRMRSRDARGLPCSDHLKEVIYRCLGARDKRYEAAGDLITSLRHKPKESATGRIKSLKGCRVAITGFLSRPRSEAIAAVKKAGAVFQSKPGQLTDVLVRGRPNALQVAGKNAGSKLMEARRLAESGSAITIIGEAQFWKLVAADVGPSGGAKKEKKGSGARVKLKMPPRKSKPQLRS